MILKIRLNFSFLKGLNDEEEFVVYRVLKALACLVRLSLLKRKLIYDHLQQVAPLVCHPVRSLHESFTEIIIHQYLESLVAIRCDRICDKYL